MIFGVWHIIMHKEKITYNQIAGQKVQRIEAFVSLFLFNLIMPWHCFRSNGKNDKSEWWDLHARGSTALLHRSNRFHIEVATRNVEKRLL